MYVSVLCVVKTDEYIYFQGWQRRQSCDHHCAHTRSLRKRDALVILLSKANLLWKGSCWVWVETVKMDGRDITKTDRWNNDIRNEDGSTNCQNEIVCGHHSFLNFLKRNPTVRKYRTTTMRIMRAKKATSEVFVLSLPALHSSSQCVSFVACFVAQIRIRKAHFDGFNTFLDRLVREGHLTKEQVGCCCVPWCAWLLFTASLLACVSFACRYMLNICFISFESDLSSAVLVTELSRKWRPCLLLCPSKSTWVGPDPRPCGRSLCVVDLSRKSWLSFYVTIIVSKSTWVGPDPRPCGTLNWAGSDDRVFLCECRNPCESDPFWSLCGHLAEPDLTPCLLMCHIMCCPLFLYHLSLTWSPRPCDHSIL